MMLWFALACHPDEDTSFWNYKPVPEPSTEPSDDSGVEPSALLEDFDDGDPIVHIGTDPEPGSIGMGPSPEWITAAILDENTVIMAGQGAIGTMDIQTGAVLSTFNAPRGVHIDASDGMAVVSTRTDQIMLYDVSDPNNINPGISIPNDDTPHEGVAIQGDRVFVGWRSNGLRVYNLDLQLVSTFEGDDVSVVDVYNNRAAVVDGKKLKLLDISNTASLSLITAFDLAGPATDIMLDERHIAVALGSRGVEIFEYDNTALTRKGQSLFSGAAQGLSLDGDHLWVSTWTGTSVVYIGGDAPLILGFEPPVNSSFAVAAQNNRAVIADWYYSTAYQLVEGVAAAEAYLPKELHFQNDDQSHQWFSIFNAGARTLEITFEEPSNGYVLNTAGSHAIPAGERLSLSIATAGSDGFGDGTLAWTSNDPDNPSGEISLRPADGGMGSSHPDFELPIVSYPNGVTGNLRLSDHLGKVIYLSWWADY